MHWNSIGERLDEAYVRMRIRTIKKVELRSWKSNSELIIQHENCRNSSKIVVEDAKLEVD